MYDMIIIGAGVTGFAAGMYAKRMGLQVLVLGTPVGGTIMMTDIVENYPGFTSISGMGLADAIKDHALATGAEFNEEHVYDIKKTESGFSVITKAKSYDTKTVLFATGTKFRTLDIPGEKEFFAKGVHTCALCDAAFYKHKTVAVIGGSDSAGKEALLLAKHTKKVFIIYRKEKIRPEPITYDRIIETENIEIINNTNLMEIKGEQTVTSVILDNPYNGNTELQLNGVFLAIGHLALSELANKIGVELNEKGEIIINRNAETNIPGIYAAGDVADTAFKQAITGVAEGVTAAYHAFQYLQKKQ